MKRLKEIAEARSGDKGTSVNIGVIAHTKSGYKILKEQLTEERVMVHFNAKVVKRYLWPRLLAINFILEDVLESESLRLDSQGKVFGVALLEIEIDESRD